MSQKPKAESRWDPSGLELAASVEPLRRAIEELVAAARAVEDKAGRLADVASPAMRELEREAEYAGGWGDEPFGNVNSYLLMALFAAEDQLLDVCALETPSSDATTWRAPVFGPATLARSVVENAARAAFLAEPDLSYLARAARGAAERLHSAYWQNDGFPSPKHREILERMTIDVEAEADRRGLLFTAPSGRGVTVGEPRPGNRAAVKLLLDSEDDQAHGDPDARGLGHHAYAYYSGITHGVFWATSSAIDRDSPFTSPAQPDRQAIVVNTDRLAMALQVSALAYTLTLDRVLPRFGWSIPGFAELRKAVADAVPHRLRARAKAADDGA